MKKMLLLVLTSLVLGSCNKDDGQSANPLTATIIPTEQNIAGKWYYSKTIQADGSIVNYVGECPEKRDAVIISRFRSVEGYLNASNCVDMWGQFTEGCNSFYIDQFGIIRNCSDSIQGKITLTTYTMRLDYDHLQYNSFPALNNIKGVILSRL